MVEIQAPSRRRARSCRPRSCSPARMRARNSPAALRVYVMTSSDSTSKPCSQTARTKRSAGTLLQQPARHPGSRERAVDAAERLDADEVAQDEHVERDLQAQLVVDLLRRRRRAARLVVLHDPARAERVDVDPVDLAAQEEPVAEREPALQLRCGALEPEAELEPARHELQRRPRLVADKTLEVAPEALLALGRLH